MSAYDQFRTAANLSSEIESLEGLESDIRSTRFHKDGVSGEVRGSRVHGLRVRMPKTTALRLLTAEIARKKATLAALKKELLK